MLKSDPEGTAPVTGKSQNPGRQDVWGPRHKKQTLNGMQSPLSLPPLEHSQQQEVLLSPFHAAGANAGAACPATPGAPAQFQTAVNYATVSTTSAEQNSESSIDRMKARLAVHTVKMRDKINAMSKRMDEMSMRIESLERLAKASVPADFFDTAEAKRV